MPKQILLSIRIHGLKLEATNPAWLINALAGGVLRELLAAELAAEGLLTEPRANVRTPFLGWILFEVSDVHEAGRTVWNVLQRNGLDPWAIVFRFDRDEEIWRSIYPRGIVRMIKDVAAEIKAGHDEGHAVLALWKQAINGPNPEESDASKQ